MYNNVQCWQWYENLKLYFVNLRTSTKKFFSSRMLLNGGMRPFIVGASIAKALFIRLFSKPSLSLLYLKIIEFFKFVALVQIELDFSLSTGTRIRYSMPN